MLCANMEGTSLRGCNFEDPAGSRANMEGKDIVVLHLFKSIFLILGLTQYIARKGADKNIVLSFKLIFLLKSNLREIDNLYSFCKYT